MFHTLLAGMSDRLQFSRLAQAKRVATMALGDCRGPARSSGRLCSVCRNWRSERYTGPSNPLMKIVSSTVQAENCSLTEN